MQKLFSNISFIGGIHGVGKSTICKKICTDLNIEYLSASKVLKWDELNKDYNNKTVNDIFLTQNRLIDGLKKVVDKNKYYLLDGHYCVLDQNSKITPIPFEIFEQINPVSLLIITGEISEIKSRLELRDGCIYDYALLEDMQNKELEYAYKLSNFFNIELVTGIQKDISNIIVTLNKLLAKKNV